MARVAKDNFGFLRVSAAVPKAALADIDANQAQILDLIEVSAKKGTSIITFPELAITGYSLGDLFHQTLLQERALLSLKQIRDFSKKFKIIICVGLPIVIGGKLFNVAAMIFRGGILGLVPKTYLPNYKEFYEERWFSSARDLSTVEIDLFGQKVPVGSDLLFRNTEIPELVLGVEICEDVWTPVPPSSLKVLGGATVIANLSASNELVGKSEYRRNLIVHQSASGICGYIYASAGVHESTTDVVYSGHALIAENGALLKEGKRFSREKEIIYADLDLEHIIKDRIKMTSFGEGAQDFQQKKFRIIDFSFKLISREKLDRDVAPHPFIPEDLNWRNRAAEEIFSIQTAGLAKRIEQSGLDKMVLGISGGLDSTLALLVAVRTAELLKLPLKNIHTYTLPGFATTGRTKSNAVKLAKILNVNFSEIDITPGCLQQLKDIGHDSKTQDIVFENVQARQRTMILMNKANQLHGLVIGTGDLSEIALGWNTFTGDHISHYNVNCGVPKTLVRHLVEWASNQSDFEKAEKILADILDTPISPELSNNNKKEITQKTEDLIGPYELHDFFLYHFLRWGSSPKKILFLADKAFDNKYSPQEIKKWLKVFIRRFLRSQWKRSVMPDGPVGSVSLSPRGDWRMPSDAEVKNWLDDLK